MASRIRDYQRMHIKLLPETLVNQIAAGEVIERPASAAKELIENAVDAGATRVEIATAGGGKALLRVTDNGFGMSIDDLELAVRRHCTSKLDDGLENIRTLGFRGEALPSIGSVAKLSITSRPRDAGEGAEIQVIGGKVSEPRPRAANSGTIVEVRDLFFATPARLKFLKSEKAEAAEASQPKTQTKSTKSGASDAKDDDKSVNAKAHGSDNGAAGAATSKADGAHAQAAAGLHTENATHHSESAADDKADGVADTIRLVSADGKGRAVDVSLSAKAGEAVSEDSNASQGKVDFVTVLEQRRYLGFSSESNASALTNAIKSDTSWAQAIRNASLDGSATASEVNTLKLQLNPDHLGSMTASLRLKGDELSVDLRVETIEAYRQLSSDHDSIVKSLRDQGFAVDQVTVQLSPATKMDSGSNADSQTDGRQNNFDNQGDNARQRDDSGRRQSGQDILADKGQVMPSADPGNIGVDADGDRNLYL